MPDNLLSEWQVSGVWPPTTGLWTVRFIAMFVLIAALTPWRRGRPLLILAGVAPAAAGLWVLAASDARLALLTVAGMFAAAAMAGTAFTKVLGFRGAGDMNGLERIGFGALFGFGLFSIAAGLLSAAGWLNRGTAFAIVLGGGLAGWRHRSDWWPLVAAARESMRLAWRTQDLRWHAFGTASLGVLALFPLSWALAPSVQWDALSAHLPTSAAMISSAGFQSVCNYWFAYVPGQAYLLYALGLATAGQPAPELIHFAFGAILTLLVYALGRRLGGVPAGWIAALLFASMPVIAWEAGSAYIDLIPAGFGFGSIYALIRWGETRRISWLLAAGGLLGLGAASKPAAALILGPGIVYVVFISLRGRLKPGWATSAALYAVPVLLFLAPWCLRNWVWKRNPFYPSMARFFHNSEVLSFQLNWSHFGVGKGVVDFLRLPWDLVFHGHAFDEAGYAVFGFVPLLATAGALLAVGTRWRGARAVVWMSAGTTACWFATAQVARYLLAAAPAAAVLAAIPLAAVISIPRRRVQAGAVALLALTGALALGYLRGVGTRWNYNIPDGYPYLHALGFESRDEYLRRALRIYPALEQINAALSRGSKIYSPTSQMRWYVNAPLEDAVFRPDLHPLVRIRAAEDLMKALRSRGYNFVLVDGPLMRDPTHPLFNLEVLKRHCELEYSGREVSVYKMRRTPLQDSESPVKELLGNGTFEVAGAEAPAGWYSFGKPVARVRPGEAHSGAAFVEVGQEDGFYQRVPMGRRKTFTLRLWARAASPQQSVWLQVVWMDRNFKIIGTEITAAPVTPKWQSFTRAFTATEPQASYAQVYARAAAGNRVYVDDVSFAPGW